MSTDLEPVTGQPIAVLDDTPIVPRIIAVAGDDAIMRFVEFFTAEIHNPNTRQAYGCAVTDFCRWCNDHVVHAGERVGMTLALHLAADLQRLRKKRLGLATSFPSGVTQRSRR